MEGFGNYLRNNTTIKERTILNYVRAVRRFHEKFDEANVEDINKFISGINRRTSITLVKYAFKYYLEFLGKGEDYKKLVGVRVKPRKNDGVYLPDDILINIVNNIENENYRFVARIQYLTGARASDVLRFTYNDLTVNPDMSLTLRLKDVKKNEYTVFIGKKYSFSIANHIQTCGRKYSFLLGESDSIRKLVDNNYRYYWGALKKSAKELGYPKFSTHDFRRNFAEDARKFTNNDIIAVKSLLGHKRIETTLRYINQRKSDEEKKELTIELRG